MAKHDLRFLALFSTAPALQTRDLLRGCGAAGGGPCLQAYKARDRQEPTVSHAHYLAILGPAQLHTLTSAPPLPAWLESGRLARLKTRPETLWWEEPQGDDPAQRLREATVVAKWIRDCPARKAVSEKQPTLLHLGRVYQMQTPDVDNVHALACHFLGEGAAQGVLDQGLWT